MNTKELIEHLELAPHPEGGFYRETWRSGIEIETRAGGRNAGTAILFLLPAGVTSAWHRVASDELWLWQGGDPVSLQIRDSPDGEIATYTVGPLSPQVLVPASAWQSASPQHGPHGYTLCGCVVVPGFDFADFEMQSGE